MASSSSKDASMASTPQILPASAYEINCVLTFVRPPNSGTEEEVCLGQLTEGGNDLPHVLVRLGTQATVNNPSNVGFRIFLKHEDRQREEIEGHYHILSSAFNANGNLLHHGVAAEDDTASLENRLDHLSANEIYYIEFQATKRTELFAITHHGEELRSSDPVFISSSRTLESVIQTGPVKLFFKKEDLLVRELNGAIKRGYKGVIAPSWEEALSEDALPTWSANIQTRMAEGFVEVINVLNLALRCPKLIDGPETGVSKRALAQLFKIFCLTTFPLVTQEPLEKVYPLFLNVASSRCVELPFGGSMFNKENLHVGIDCIRSLLRFQIPGARIGVVAFYPAQKEAYRTDIARLHDQDIQAGFNEIFVGTLDDWIGKQVGIAIVDLVRTRNAGGNLGWLSQSRRLKAALMLHSDGLILIGRRDCTVASSGESPSIKLEKTLQWLQDHGRIADIAQGDLLREDNKHTKKPRANFTKQLVMDHPSLPSLIDAVNRFQSLTFRDGTTHSEPVRGLGDLPSYRNVPRDATAVNASFKRQWALIQDQARETKGKAQALAGSVRKEHNEERKNEMSRKEPIASKPSGIQSEPASHPIVAKGRGDFLYDQSEIHRVKHPHPLLEKPQKSENGASSIQSTPSRSSMKKENVPMVEVIPPTPSSYHSMASPKANVPILSSFRKVSDKWDNIRYKNKFDAVQTIYKTAPMSQDLEPLNVEERRLFGELGKSFNTHNTEAFNNAYMDLITMSRRRFGRSLR